MPLPIVIVIKATALLAAAALFDALLRPRGSAAARHLVWTLAVAALLALPIASLALPEWTIRLPIAQTVDAAPVASVGASSGSVNLTAEERAFMQTDEALPRMPSVSWFTAIAAIYLAGVLLLLARLAIEPIGLRRLMRASHDLTGPEWRDAIERASAELRLTRRVRLLQSAREIMPLTFGTLAPVIVLPRSSDAWAEDRKRAVLLHELAHVARRDCLVQRMTAFACALYWPHPGVWWAARRLRAERELACDDRVLAAGAGAREYAGHLLELAHSLGSAPAPATALGMARPKQLESRLLAVLDAARNRASIHPRVRTISVAAAILVLGPLAAVHAALVSSEAPATQAVPRIGLVSQSSAPAAQDLTGSWELRVSRDPATAQVTVHTEHGTHGRSVALNRIPIPAEQITARSASIRLPITREAGTFNVDGTCRSGVCGGTFAFEPSQTFAAELVKRGLERPTPQQQMDLALADVGVAYLDALQKAGYARPSLDDVVRAAQHGVDAVYLRDMTALGYRVGTLDALTRLRDHGVDAAYVRGMSASGFANLPVEDVLRARDHGVDPEYVKGMRDLGYRIGALEDVIRLRDHGIDPAYVRGMSASGFSGLTIEQLLKARDHGVDASYIREMAALGYQGASVEALIRMRDHGVDPHYVKDMAELGYKGLPSDDLIRLRDHGVDGAYVRRVQQKGLGHLTVDELIERRDRGMDDPDAAARAVAAQVQSLWQSIVRWMRS